MRVAIIHHWLIAFRGGEKVLAELCELFPHADIYTHVVDKSVLPLQLASRNIRTTFINNLPLSKRWYQKYLFLMPIALESLDLQGYDCIISIESGPAKGVLTHPKTLHICYCNTPMRYVWNMSHEYTQSSGIFQRAIMALLFHYLRIWDRLSADRVDFFVANSENVAQRIDRYYRRDSTVIYPPVDVHSFFVSDVREDYYLFVGQLVGYKRADLAVAAFTQISKRLVIIGEGDQLARLRKIAGPTVEFLGRQSSDVLKKHYSRCKALIFPGEEDFGIVPLEAMASGRPVIAFGRGGALETVVENMTGLFFYEQSVDALIAAIDAFEIRDHEFVADDIRKHALQFSQERFRMEFEDFISIKMAAFCKKRSLAGQ